MGVLITKTLGFASAVCSHCHDDDDDDEAGRVEKRELWGFPSCRTWALLVVAIIIGILWNVKTQEWRAVDNELSSSIETAWRRWELFPQILFIRSLLFIHLHTSTFHFEMLVFGSLETTHSYCRRVLPAHRISHTDPKKQRDWDVRMRIECARYGSTEIDWIGIWLCPTEELGKECWFGLCASLHVWWGAAGEKIWRRPGMRGPMRCNGRPKSFFVLSCLFYSFHSIQSMFGRTSAVSSEREIIRWETWRQYCAIRRKEKGMTRRTQTLNSV